MDIGFTVAIAYFDVVRMAETITWSLVVIEKWLKLSHFVRYVEVFASFSWRYLRIFL